MPNFRICTVMASGRIATAHVLKAETEAEAIARAFDYLDDQPTLELWCGAQRVVQLDQSVLRAAA